jgi:hypothetical protein
MLDLITPEVQNTIEMVVLSAMFFGVVTIAIFATKKA